MLAFLLPRNVKLLLVGGYEKVYRKVCIEVQLVGQPGRVLSIMDRQSWS